MGSALEYTGGERHKRRPRRQEGDSRLRRLNGILAVGRLAGRNPPTKVIVSVSYSPLRPPRLRRPVRPYGRKTASAAARNAAAVLSVATRNYLLGPVR